jgi:hypothetical protein
METYYLIQCSTGKSSGSLRTIADVAMWIENNIDDKVRHFTVKQLKQDRDKLKKEIAKDIQRVEERLNRLKEKQDQITRD